MKRFLLSVGMLAAGSLWGADDQVPNLGLGAVAGSSAAADPSGVATTAPIGSLLISSGSAWATATMSGDATMNSVGVLALANIGSATGPTGSATTVPVVTIDAKGRVTGLTSAPVTAVTNANLTGPITSVGNATGIAAQTGTGTTFAMSASPTFTGTATMAALVDTGTFTATGAAVFAGGMTIADPTTPSKALTFNLAGASANATATIASAQTASRTFTIPVASGNDTFGLLGLGQTWTGINAFNALVAANGTAGMQFKGAATTGQGASGADVIYRVGSGLQNPGSLVLQADIGQAASNIAFYTSSTSTLALTLTATGCLVATGLADANNQTAAFSSGGSATIAAAVMTEINTTTATIASYYLWLPAAPNNGQIVDFVSEGVITSLTVSGNGHTLIGAPTAAAQYATYRWIYNNAAATWYREQ